MAFGIMAWDRLLLFIGAELVFSLTPGPTVMMITAYAFKGGLKSALSAIAGTQTGNTIWYVICVTGLGALITASPLVFQTIKLLGAGYLIWLGAQSLWSSFRTTTEAHGPKLMGRPYVQAVLTQLGNPKAILFFGALLPQFLDPALPLPPQYLLLFVITFIGESVILTGYGWLAATGARTIGIRHAVWRERISGMVLLGLGLLALFEL